MWGIAVGIEKSLIFILVFVCCMSCSRSVPAPERTCWQVVLFLILSRLSNLVTSQSLQRKCRWRVWAWWNVADWRLDWVPVPASLCISCQTNLQPQAAGVMTDDWYTKRELEQRLPPTPTTGSGPVRRGQRKNTANLFISSRPWYVDVKRQAGHGAAVVSPLIEFKASFVFFTVEEF